MKLKIQLDITKMNNPERFQAELTYDNLIQALFFGRQQSISDIQQLLKTISDQAFSIKYKWLYVAFKWLIFFHQCLNLIQQNNSQLISAKKILDFLNRIEYPKAWSKHEQYLLKKLFIPYTQYLVKMASILQIKSQAQSSSQHYIFLQFNLLRFAIAEFMHPICEFSRYFKQRYPHLSKCFSLISKQVNTLQKKVAVNYEQKQLQQMYFIEVDQLSQSLVFFSTEKQINHKSNSTAGSNEGGKQKNSPFTEKIIHQFPEMEFTSMVLNS